MIEKRRASVDRNVDSSSLISHPSDPVINMSTLYQPKTRNIDDDQVNTQLIESAKTSKEISAQKSPK